MNNISNFGQHLINLQYNLNNINNRITELQNTVNDLIAKDTGGQAVTAAVAVAPSSMDAINAMNERIAKVEGKVQKMEEMNESLESIFSTLQAPAIQAPGLQAPALQATEHQPSPSQETTEVPDRDGYKTASAPTTPIPEIKTDVEDINDIVVVPKKQVTKKKPAKK
jgi:prefoldin subunit 5